jgi:AraC-like DNA-binding protein
MCALLEEGSTTPSHELKLAELARRSGLSERQLREVFVRDTGLSPRAYLRWRRLRRAVSSIREGASLTQAAVQAGFADGAHFSRVFRSQFGMSPTRAFVSMRFGIALSSA